MTDWMESIEVPAAVNVMALEVIALAVLAVADDTRNLFPEIGEHDWARIIDRARQLAQPPTPLLRRRAYDLFTRRAAGGQ